MKTIINKSTKLVTLLIFTMIIFIAFNNPANSDVAKKKFRILSGIVSEKNSPLKVYCGDSSQQKEISKTIATDSRLLRNLRQISRKSKQLSFFYFIEISFLIDINNKLTDLNKNTSSGNSKIDKKIIRSFTKINWNNPSLMKWKGDCTLAYNQRD